MISRSSLPRPAGRSRASRAPCWSSRPGSRERRSWSRLRSAPTAP